MSISITVKEVHEAYKSFTGKASDIVRHLAFAGIGLVWLFKKDSPRGPVVDPELILPATLIVVALAADLLQYVSAGAAWGWYQWRKISAAQEENPDKVLHPPACLNWPGTAFYWIKIATTIVAYVLLGSFLIQHLTPVLPSVSAG